jgi:hypothetical protein
MLVLSVDSAVLMLVRTFCAVQRIMGMIAIHVLVKMSMLVGVGVRMRMDDLAMPVFMSVDMRNGHVRAYAPEDGCARDRDRCRACDLHETSPGDPI